ncbi:PGA26 Predicted GPI-anchored protein 26 [Candida maltosa Xu316]
MQFSKIAAISALSTAALAVEYNSTVTEHVTITGYTTYCPYPTTITVTVCEEENICTEKEIPVEGPTTVTITEPCIVPSDVIAPTVAPVIPASNATTFEGNGNKNVAGALVGFAAIAAALM